MSKQRKYQKVKLKAKYTWTEEDMEMLYIYELASVPEATKRGVAKKKRKKKKKKKKKWHSRLCKWTHNE